MASTTLAYRSSLKISSLSRTIDSVNKTFGSVEQTTNTIAKTLTERNQQKQKLISDKTKFFLARREAVRKREQESIIEASSIGGTIKRTNKVVMDSTKGFLGRILDFAGTLLVGWLLLNLPRIIDGTKKLIERIQKLVTTLSNAVGNVTDFLFTIGDTLSGVLRDVASFNFGNIRNTVEDGMSKMNQSIRKLENDIIFAINLLLRPLDFGFGLDDKVPGTKSGVGSDFGGYTEPSGGVSNGRVNPQAVYQYLRSLGVSHIHSMGILANIQGESGFRVAADEAGDGSRGIGLFQYTYPTRKKAFLEAVPDYKTNWKGQVRFAVGESTAPQYLASSFGSPEAAAAWWMRNWERPDTALYGSRDDKHNKFIESFKVPQPTTAKGPIKLGPKLSKDQDVSRMIANGGVSASVTSLYGMRGDKMHRGIDIAAPMGTHIALRVDCEVMGTANDRSGYGLVIDVWVPQYGVQLRFGHCSKFLITSGKIPAGKSFATVGSTGRSDGPHIHFEYTREKDSRKGGSDGDPSPYVPLILLTTGPSSSGSLTTSSKPSAAQISVTKNNEVAQKITTERKGDEVVVVRRQPSEPVSPASVISSGSQMITGGKGLNTFIKEVLFLNLAST